LIKLRAPDVSAKALMELGAVDHFSKAIIWPIDFPPSVSWRWRAIRKSMA